MNDPVDARIRALMDEVERVAPPPPDFAALPTTDKRGARAQRRRVIGLAIALVVAAVGVVVIARRASHDVSTISPNPGPSVTEPAALTSIGTTPAPATTPTTATTPPTSTTSTTSTTAVASPPPVLIVHPFGSRSEAVDIRVIDANVTTVADATDPGDVALTYELQIGFDPKSLDSAIEPSTTTSDGQLTIETACATPGCLSLRPVNDLIQTKVELTVRRTTVPLTPGEHDAPFAIHFADGSTEQFSVGLYAEPAPSEAMSTRATTLGGAPTAIQTVFDAGHFGYHMISAFGSIWVLGHSDRSVSRIDAVTGAVLTSIPIGVSSNRLTANADAVYVAGDPVLRIDPTTNAVTPVTAAGLTVNARAIIADGDTLWTASFTEGMHRIDPDGTVTGLKPATPAAWIDLAVSNGKVWALGRDINGARLVSFDEITNTPIDDVTIPIGPNYGVPVRLVADEGGIVAGIDPRTGGANGFQSSGQLVIVDPTTATIIATIPLTARPEGIVLTGRHIWTSGAVLDRTTLAVTPISLGFTITRGPDGSIWATTGVPGTADAASIAVRYAPGDRSG